MRMKFKLSPTTNYGEKMFIHTKRISQIRVERLRECIPSNYIVLFLIDNYFKNHINPHIHSTKQHCHTNYPLLCNNVPTLSAIPWLIAMHSQSSKIF